MTDYLEQMGELIWQARELEHGPAQVALVEQAVRLADTHDDIEAGFEARQELIQAATFSGQPDVMLVAFSWCLAQCDADPERFDEGDLLWKYKWVMDNVADFPQVSKAQIDEMFADMARRYERAGSTLHAVYQMRRDIAVYMGDRETADRAQLQLLKVRRDWLSNCPACVADAAVDYLLLREQYAEAIKNAAPILEGRMKCAEVPHRTYATILVPLVRLGRVDEAMGYHQKGYRLIIRNPKFIRYQAQHVLFLALTDNLPRALKLLERHLGDALETCDLAWRFEFFRAARFALDRVADKTSLKLRLPRSFPLHDKEGQYEVAKLGAWFTEQLRELAVKFDARNGNDYFTRRIAELDTLKTFARSCPLPAKDRGASSS